jgi:flagellar hook-basal body protein
MIRALYTAASGMSAQQSNLDTVANNLANSATTGFRSRKMQFEDMIYQNLVMPGSASSTSTTSAGLQIGLGTKSVSSEVIMTQGDFNQTGNSLDLAIQGAGFFQVQLPNGTIAYTRDGNFSMNNAGVVVDANGDQLLPAVTIPSNATNVTISKYGVVSATLPDSIGDLPQSGRVEHTRRKSATADLVLGQRNYRCARREQRDGHDTAGISGELERGCGGRVRQYDSGAAGLREQLEGGACGRRYVLADQRYGSLMRGLGGWR